MANTPSVLRRCPAVPARPTTPPPARCRLTRVQQLTLTTWRWAFDRVCHEVQPHDLLPQVALQAVLEALRGCTDPLELFSRHGHAAAEFALVASLLPDRPRTALDFDLVDSAFLLRWEELTADGSGPEELPPLAPQPAEPRRRAHTDLDAAAAIGTNARTGPR
jgi:hypothetical protein